MKLIISAFVLAVLISYAANSRSQTATSGCDPGPVSISFLTKPGDGWDVTFVKQANVISKGPFILSNGKDSGLTFVEYHAKKQLITLPHIEVNPCDHAGTIRYWYFVPKQVIGFEKSGHLFAYQVWARIYLTRPRFSAIFESWNTP